MADGTASPSSFMSFQTHHSVSCGGFESFLTRHPSLELAEAVSFARVLSIPSFQTRTVIVCEHVLYSHYRLEQALLLVWFIVNTDSSRCFACSFRVILGPNRRSTVVLCHSKSSMQLQRDNFL